VSALLPPPTSLVTEEVEVENGGGSRPRREESVRDFLPTSVSTRVLTLVGKRTSNKSVEQRFESPSPLTPSLRSGGFYILIMLTSHYKVSPLG
jgi:hypothetical protein